MKTTIVSILGGLIATLAGGSAALAQATETPTLPEPDAPSVSVPLCAELAFDAAAFVRELQLELADHRADALAEAVPDQADPAGIAIAIDIRCGVETSEAVIRIVHRETGHGALRHVDFEGESAEERGRQLALATSGLLWERWADLGRPVYIPIDNPYRLAYCYGNPGNPYRYRAVEAPADNPYRYAPPPSAPPAEAPVDDHDVDPTNPYVG